MKRLILLTAIVCMVITTHAIANPTPGYITNGNMDWNRGAENSTWQEWDFLAGGNPASPDGFYNPNGDPIINLYEVPVLNPVTAFAWHETYLGRTGVWVGDAVYADITIPNTDFTGGAKTVWMEVAFAAATIDQFPVIQPFIAGGQEGNFESQQLSLTITPDEDDWCIMNVSWLITPNPQSETITIGFAGTGGYIDYVTVDTICVPVPGAVILGSIGVGLVGWFRRRKFA